jgi:ABC-type transport system involved in multi-copper enzyme maturation permease subunit
MSTAVLSRAPSAPTTAVTPPFDRSALRLTPARAVRAEWIKLTTLRSTWVTLAAIVLAIAGIGVIASATFSSSAPAGVTAAESFAVTLGGSALAVLVVGALGATVGAREHQSGMIRTTVAAVPHRTTVVLAKAAALTALLVPAVVVGVVTSVVVGGSILRGVHVPTLALTDPLALRAMGGTVVYLAGVGLIGLAVGILLRSVAGAVATVIGVVLLLPAILGAMLPASWDRVLELLPSQAGEALTTVTAPAAGSLSAGAGLADFLAWVVVALAAASLVLTRRDA